MSIISKIDPEVIELIQQEVRLGIVLGLDFFGAMNLRELAKFVGKTEPTTFTHVQKLLESDLIEEDYSIERRGKFYQLSEKGQVLLKEADLEVDTKDKVNRVELDEETVKFLTSAFRSISLVSKNVSNYICTYIDENLDEVVERSKQDDPMSSSLNIAVTLSSLKFYDNEELSEFKQIQEEYLAKLFEFEDRQKSKKNKGELLQNQFIYIFSAPISKFGPGLV